MKNKIQIANKAKNIKLIATDVDGVLTDGSIIILDSGEEVKVWDVYDRLAFTLIRNYGNGLKLAWITGRQSRQVATRAAEVGVHYLYQKCSDKLIALNEIMKKEGISSEEVAYIGDDLLDMPPILCCGFSACPAGAVAEVKETVDYVTERPGGRGAFRELVEIILKAKGLWDEVLKHYCS